MLNNEFPIHTHKTPTIGHPPTTPSDRKTGTYTQKWASFTYVSKDTTYITNLFKKTDMKIALRTRNTIQKRLMQKHMTPDKYTRSGAYKLTCPDCDKAYIGQTGTALMRDIMSTNMHSKPTAILLISLTLSRRITHIRPHRPNNASPTIP